MNNFWHSGQFFSQKISDKISERDKLIDILQSIIKLKDAWYLKYAWTNKFKKVFFEDVQEFIEHSGH